MNKFKKNDELVIQGNINKNYYCFNNCKIVLCFFVMFVFFAILTPLSFKNTEWALMFDINNLKKIVIIIELIICLLLFLIMVIVAIKSFIVAKQYSLIITNKRIIVSYDNKKTENIYNFHEYKDIDIEKNPHFRRGKSKTYELTITLLNENKLKINIYTLPLKNAELIANKLLEIKRALSK